jgi:hypothetical protein
MTKNNIRRTHIDKNVQWVYNDSVISKIAISANQAITGGTTFLQLDAGGTFTPVTTGAIVAQALDSLASQTTIGIISARLMLGNAATA